MLIVNITNEPTHPQTCCIPILHATNVKRVIKIGCTIYNYAEYSRPAFATRSFICSLYSRAVQNTAIDKNVVLIYWSLVAFTPTCYQQIPLKNCSQNKDRYSHQPILKLFNLIIACSLL